MLTKHRVLAVTKCDLLDDELIEMLRETLPNDLPCVFISAVAGKGLDELKDVLWRELNAESNKLAAVMAEDTLVHRDKDMTRFAEEQEDERQRIGGLWLGMGETDDIENIEDVDELDDFEYEEEE
jgi:GTP-binding protein